MTPLMDNKKTFHTEKSVKGYYTQNHGQQQTVKAINITQGLSKEDAWPAMSGLKPVFSQG